MEMHLVVQGKNAPPQLNLKPPVVDLTNIESIHFCVIEEGMKSGEPSVIISVESPVFGSVALQTSLDKFMAAASGMASAAETHWGWKRPEGYFSLLPPDPKTRKTLLESIKKELEEWDESQT